MKLRVIGAGLGRTGTHSLKLALERLLGGPCYHMVEVFERREHVSRWHAATRGETASLHGLLDGYAAAVDWPASAFWRELSELHPEAIIVLSTRDPQSWWRSANQTIFETFKNPSAERRDDAWYAMITQLLRDRFTPGFLDEATAIDAYERHVEDVRKSAPKQRLVEWHPSSGWEPLCTALGVPVPSEPFPHSNTTEEFRARAGLDG